MGNKQYKIKRYSNIYGPNTSNRRPIKIIFTIAAIVLCCFLGWAIYMPTYNFLMGLGNEKDSSAQSSSPASSEVPLNNLPAESLGTEVSENESAPKENNINESQNSINKGGVFVPLSLLSDNEQFESFLKNIKEKGCTSVVVDAKNAAGEVLFLSKNEIAIKSSAIIGNAFDAKIIAKTIKNNGLIPVARVHAFRDGISAMSNNDMAVKYYDTDYIWLDNSSQLGGRGWLNPYSDKATEYIGKLTQELLYSGFEEVIIDSLQYPQGVGREKMGFGATNINKSEQLSLCMNKIQSYAQNNGGKVSFVITSKDYEQDGEMLYGGDFLNYSDYSLAFTSSINEIDFTKNLISQLNEIDKNADVILLSYNSDGSQANEDDIKTLLNQLTKININKVYLYNPQGIY